MANEVGLQLDEILRILEREQKKDNVLKWLCESIEGTGVRAGKLLQEWNGEDSFYDYCLERFEAETMVIVQFVDR